MKVQSEIENRIFEVIRDVHEQFCFRGWDWALIVAKNLLPDLREEFLKRPEGYLSDFVFWRFVREPCYLFRHNWQSESHAVEQMLKAGLSPLDARKIALGAPYESEAMTAEQKMTVLAICEGLVLREEKQEPKQTREKPSNVDLSVSDVAKILRVSRSSIVSSILSGKLQAYRAEPPGSKRPTWRVSKAALEDFRRPAEVQTQEAMKRRKSASKSDVIEFY